MAVVLPKIIRAMRMCPETDLSVDRGRDVTQLACWNWAVTGLQADAVNITALYDYVNSGGPFMEDGGGTIEDLHALGYPNLTMNLKGQLTALRNLWAPNKAAAFDGAKRRLIDAHSKTCATIVAQVYGLPVTNDATGIEIGMHFEDNVVRGQLRGIPEPLDRLAERQEMLGIGFEHWWIHFTGGPLEPADDTREGPVVEIWTNRGSLRWARLGQVHNHLKVWRQNVTQLHQAHIDWLLALIQARKGRAPFVHPVARQAWAADDASETCTWCERPFTDLRVRQRCRACGLLFCADCTPKTENVVRPASPDNAAAAGISRVCDTCYTGND